MRLFGQDIRIRPARKWLARRSEEISRRAIESVARLMAKREFKGAFEVRPSSDGWMVARAGSSLPLHVFAKKPDAIKEAKRLAREKKTHVDVFTRQGSLQMRQSFA